MHYFLTAEGIFKIGYVYCAFFFFKYEVVIFPFQDGVHNSNSTDFAFVQFPKGTEYLFFVFLFAKIHFCLKVYES